MNGGTPYDKSRQTDHWLMTKHALVKKGIIENKNGNANCTCGKIETQNGTHYRIAKNKESLRCGRDTQNADRK